MRTSAESPSVSGEIGGKEAIEARIKEKEDMHQSLLRSHKAKFEAVKAIKAENDRQKAVIKHLHEKGSLSTESYAAEMTSMQEKLDEAMRDAQKELDLAVEYREEAEKLRAEIDENAN